MQFTGITSSFSVRSAARILLGTAVALTTIATSGVAAQAAAEPSLKVNVSRLVLEPGERGYQGSITVALTYRGGPPTYAGFDITEPIAGSFRSLTPDDACIYTGYTDDGRLEANCMVPGGELKRGQKREFTIDFDTLTTPQAVAMTAADTQLTFTALDDTLSASATSRTLFRSTTGSLRNPVPFVQDTESNLTAEAADVTLTRREDGRFAGRVPVVASWLGNAPHDTVGVNFDLPEGVEFEGLDPSEACGGTACVVPGGRMMQGEVRTFWALVSVAADTPLGALGTGTVQISSARAGDRLTDVTPADNTASYTLTVA